MLETIVIILVLIVIYYEIIGKKEVIGSLRKDSERNRKALLKGINVARITTKDIHTHTVSVEDDRMVMLIINIVTCDPEHYRMYGKQTRYDAVSYYLKAVRDHNINFQKHLVTLYDKALSEK